MNETTMLRPLTGAMGRRTIAGMPERPDDVVTSAELARHFGVSTQRVRQWVDAGCPVAAAALDPYTGKPVRPYFRIADVEAWRAANRERKGGRPRKRPPDPER
jgi:hypothetical protein